MKPPFKQKHALYLPLAIMTISILLLFSLSVFFIISASKDLSVDAQEMKLTSSQKTLSQQIVNAIAANNLNSEINGPSLDVLIDSFKQQHSALISNGALLNTGFFKNAMPAEYKQLDNTYKKFANQLEGNTIDLRGDNFVSLLNNQNVYLLQLDAFANNLTGYSNDKVEVFRIQEISILIVSVIIILMEIIFIFLPAIKKLENQNNALREISFTQAHIVRRPLTNILSLLDMMLEKKQDAYNTQLATLAKKEAFELDVAIKNNINKSDKNFAVIN